MKFLVRLLITAAALWVAVEWVPGIQYRGSWGGLMGVALIFGVVNAVVRPILKLLTCPLVLLTFGLFIFILNALMLGLTAMISSNLGLDFSVESFGAAVIGALVVSLVSGALNIFVGEKEKEKD